MLIEPAHELTLTRLKKKAQHRVLINNLSHEGRGITTLAGQKVFVSGALPGEEVTIELLGRRKKIWQAQVVHIHSNSIDRVEPPCASYKRCGGCSLQHMSLAAQRQFKSATLLEQLQHFGNISLEQLEPTLVTEGLDYRTKARLGVRFVHKKNKVLVGFRERQAPWLADMAICEVLDWRVGHRLDTISAQLFELQARAEIAQIEVACSADEVALVLRNLVPLEAADRAQLIEFAKQHEFSLYLQPGGPETVQPLWPETAKLLHYSVAGQQLEFKPLDFTQINPALNRQMVSRAIDWLDLSTDDVVMDLFCGLGNFSLPIAQHCAKVIGVEGTAAMVERAQHNAHLNGLTNCEFYVFDLMAAKDLTALPWEALKGAKLLLDPPRSGAEALVEQLAARTRYALAHSQTPPVDRIVYVSCNGATFARDAALLQAGGFVCVKAGMMDMFPHTHHFETMALFERAPSLAASQSQGL
mgnify:CR=1 FL=1